MFRYSLFDFITRNDVIETFRVWLLAIDQDPMVQDVCVTQLQTYLGRICTDVYYLESNGSKSSWIWMALCNWDYLTHSLRVPSRDN
jgi:hypothetical protein